MNLGTRGFLVNSNLGMVKVILLFAKSVGKNFMLHQAEIGFIALRLA